MSSKRTGQTIGQFNRSFRPYQSLYRISTEILVSNRNKKNSSFRSETIGDLPACCAHVLPLSLERFCHVSQTRCPFFFFFFSPFRESAPPLFLLCSFTQCPLFHIISNVSFSICLFSFFLSLSFFVLCASTTTTHVKVIPISSILCFLYFILLFYFFIYAFFFNMSHATFKKENNLPLSKTG